MRGYLGSIALLSALLCLPQESIAIDYIPSWNFSVPIDDQPPTAFEKDLLTYNTSAGTLVYKVGELGEWTPPDIGSKSGLLDTSVFLEPVPLWHPTPIFTVDESFGGQIVPGSNAIRIHFDRYAFWPWAPESPYVLQSAGLDHVPNRHSYGAVLPTGLTEDFLRSELYVTSFPNSHVELRVVPEPAAWMSLAISALLINVYGLRPNVRQGTAVNRATTRWSPNKLPQLTRQ